MLPEANQDTGPLRDELALIAGQIVTMLLEARFDESALANFGICARELRARIESASVTREEAHAWAGVVSIQLRDGIPSRGFATAAGFSGALRRREGHPVSAMGTGDGTGDELTRVRNALKAAVVRSSLRAVARAVGMSPTGLSKFLLGARPYGKTLDRVRLWFDQHAGVSRVPSERLADELRRLFVTLPEPDRGVDELLNAVDRSYRTAGMLPPEWVQRVRAVVRPPTGTATSR